MKRNFVLLISSLFPFFLNAQDISKDSADAKYPSELKAYAFVDTFQFKLDTNSIKLIERKWVKKIELIKDEKYKNLYVDKNGTIMIYLKKRFKREIFKTLKKSKNTVPNTDNKVNKLVTFFALTPAAKTDFECSYRDRARTRLSQLRTGINSQPLKNFVPRYT